MAKSRKSQPPLDQPEPTTPTGTASPPPEEMGREHPLLCQLEDAVSNLNRVVRRVYDVGYIFKLVVHDESVHHGLVRPPKVVVEVQVGQRSYI